MRRIARGFLIAVSVINGFLGVICAALLLLAPDGRFLGMGALLPVVATFPFSRVFFQDFLWIGLVMLLALGLPNLVAAVMLVRNAAGQYVATLIAGGLLLAWCSFELIYMFNFAAVAFFTVGVLSMLASLQLMRPASDRSVH